MKTYSLLVILILFSSSCKVENKEYHTKDVRSNSTTDSSELNNEVKVKENNQAVLSPIVHNENSKHNDKLSANCEELKLKYETLIKEINVDKTNKDLLNSLVSWTKNPKHLKCLDEFPVYNDFVEKINETL